MTKARIITVATNKGGVGKTCTTINCAVGLRSLDYKVACIDLDPQGHVAEGFGISRNSLKKTMFDVLLGIADMKDIKKSASGVDLYLSNGSLADLGVTVQDPSNMKMYPNPYMLLKNIMPQIEGKYQIVFVDTPPTKSIFNANALNASDDVLLILQPEQMAVNGVVDMLEFVRTIQKTSNKELKILGILATMVQNTNLHNIVLQNIRKSFEPQGIKIFDSIIKRAIKYGTAQSLGTPDPEPPEYLEFLKEAFFQ